MHWLMGAEAIQSASSVLSSDDDNCSLSITYKRHIFSPLHRDAFDTPVFITSERLARARWGLAEHASPDSCEEKRQSICLIWERAVCWEEEEREGAEREALEWGACQAIGLDIIRKKGGEPRDNAPLCLPRAHTGLCPLTPGLFNILANVNMLYDWRDKDM